jgi:hypothetical protein
VGSGLPNRSKWRSWRWKFFRPAGAFGQHRRNPRFPPQLVANNPLTAPGGSVSLSGYRRILMDLVLVGICLAVIIGLYFHNNPMGHSRWFMMRAARHEPDLFYTNKYMALIEKELFS